MSHAYLFQDAIEAQQALAGSVIFLCWLAASAITAFVVWLVGRIGGASWRAA